MKHFDERFRDFPDYIIAITRQIWEGRDIASLNSYYAKDIIVRSPGGVVKGNKGVIAATMATLAEFPDRRLLGEDVIWSGDERHGMLSSHRILSTATHLGDGVYGKASGKKLRYRIIADCHAVKNQINDEWLVRDQGAIVRQLGWTPREYAATLVAEESARGEAAKPLTQKTDIKGPYGGRGNDNEWGARYAETLQEIMGAGFNAVERNYDRAVQCEYPGGATGHSHDAVDAFWMGLRAAFPSAKFTIHHVIGRDDPHMPPRAAIRWSIDGKHDGWGAFGTPTGAPVHVLGISHVEFGAVAAGDTRIRREYTLFDETAIWKQILMHTGRT